MVDVARDVTDDVTGSDVWRVVTAVESNSAQNNINNAVIFANHSNINYARYDETKVEECRCCTNLLL